MSPGNVPRITSDNDQAKCLMPDDVRDDELFAAKEPK
jgi:hypothetical protein